MGRKKIDIEPITNDRNKTVTFLKRKQGLFKKAFELSILCSVDIQVVILGSNRQFYEYTTVDPNEFNKIYYKDNMIHNIQTPSDYDDNYALRDKINLNDTSRYKGPWNINGKTNHKRTHSGRLVYTEDDGSSFGNHHHSKSESNVSLEDIFEQDHVNKRKRLKNNSDVNDSHVELFKGVTTENILNMERKKRVNNENDSSDNNESEEKYDVDENEELYESQRNKHISAKKQRANNSSLLKNNHSNSDIDGKGNSYMFPNPLANSNLQSNQSPISSNRKAFSTLPSLDTQKIGRASQLVSAERDNEKSSNKTSYDDTRGNMSAESSMQMKSQPDFAGAKDRIKEQNDEDSDHDNLITPTSSNSLAGLNFEPNLFTPNISRITMQPSSSQLRNSPQLQQESFSRRPRLRVEIPKTNKDFLTRQQEQMQQKNNNPSSIIPLSAKGMGHTPGLLSANLFSNIQFQNSHGMMSANPNQLNTPNLNMFINVGNKSAVPGSSHNAATRTGYFDEALHQPHSSAIQNVNLSVNNNVAKQRYRRPSETEFFSNTPTSKKSIRQTLQSPTFNSFLENGLISPDVASNNKLNFKRGTYPTGNIQLHHNAASNDMGPLTAMGFHTMSALDILNGHDYQQQSQMGAGGHEDNQNNNELNEKSSSSDDHSKSQRGSRPSASISSDKEGLTKVFPQLHRQKIQNMKEPSVSGTPDKQLNEDDDVVVPVSDKPSNCDNSSALSVKLEDKASEQFLVSGENDDQDDVVDWEK